MEQLQLQVEARLFDQDEGKLAEMMEILGIEGEDSPVYEVKPEAGTGGNRILHRNLLLPCSYLPIADFPQERK